MERKSFLRWAGSKQKLVPQLKKYWDADPTHVRYIEPFMGSAQLFFSINPPRAILSDSNLELCEAFQQIKKNPYAVHKILKTFRTNEKAYYKIRSIDPSSLGVNQRAARFIYLNRLCFNGLYRTNLSGQFNVPFSHSKISKIDDSTFLRDISNKLANTKIITGDFQGVVNRNVKAGDFVYLDPPYAVGNRRIFKQYGPHTFGIDDLHRLRDTVDLIVARNANFLLSYAYCKEIMDIFPDWTIQKTFTQRNIAGFTEYRRKAAEIFITNINLNSH